MRSSRVRGVARITSCTDRVVSGTVPPDLKLAGGYSTPKPARWMSTSETSGLAGGIGTITALIPSVPVAAGCTAWGCLRSVLSRYIRLSAVAMMAS